LKLASHNLLQTFVARERLLLGLVLVLGLAIYAFSAGDFFFFDSKASVENNESIRIDGSKLDDWRTAALSTETGPLGRPLSMLSFAINHALSGEVSARDILLTNALIHAITSLVLVFFLAIILVNSPVLSLKQERARHIALLAGMLWLLHPLHVSTVLYAVQRMTQLPTFFALLGLLSFFSLRVQWLHRAMTPEDVSKGLFLVTVFTLLGAFSKENGLLLPLLVVVTEVCLFGFRVNGTQSRLLRTVCTGSLSVFTVGLCLALVMDIPWIERGYELRDFTLQERVLTQLRLLWYYLGWIGFPNISSMGFYHDGFARSHSLLEPATLLAASAWLVLLVGCWQLRTRLPILGFAVLWYLIGHSMESSVFALEMVFEHRNYLPSIGPLVLIAYGVYSLPGAARAYANYCAAALIALMALLLFSRAAWWGDDMTLAEYHYRNHPDSQRAGMQLASAYEEAALAETDAAMAQRYLIAARELSYRAHQADSDSISALVLLIFFDGNSSHPEKTLQWYQGLQAATASGGFSVSDVNYLRFLNNCVIQGDCPPPPQGQKKFLQELLQGFDSPPQLRFLLVQYCLETADLECVREEAEILQRLHPDFPQALESIFHAGVLDNDRRAMMNALRRIMKRDTSRRSINRIQFRRASS
jgi:hypothetical protein